MKVGKHKHNQGFTIVEVLMVLAVAGLIFAIVFAAVPRVQRGRRDTERKQQLATLIAEIESYGSNNRGNFPSTTVNNPGIGSPTGEIITLIESFIETSSDDFADPLTSTSYKESINNSTSVVGVFPQNTGDIYYSSQASCNSTNDQLEAEPVGRTFGAVIKLENGYFCLDNV